MTPTVDANHCYRGNDDLAELVRRAAEHGDSQESDAVELKGVVDLTSKRGAFLVARTILGMANRLPETAALRHGGYGYIIVGAQEGAIVGVESVDPVEVHKQIDAYVKGRKTPTWSDHHLSVDDKRVIVIVVEPPSAGDPIFPLRRSWEDGEKRGGERGRGGSKGTVYVRRGGETAPATDVEIDGLVERAKGVVGIPSDLISVDLRANSSIGWLDRTTVEADIGAWVDNEMQGPLRRAQVRRAMLARPAPMVADDLDPTASIPTMADMLGGMRGMSAHDTVFEPRSFDEFSAEVERWGRELTEFSRKSLPSRIAETECCTVCISVRNESDVILDGLSIVLDLSGQLVAVLDAEQECLTPPDPPIEWGKQKHPGLFDALVNQIPDVNYDFRVPPLPSADLNIDDRARTIEFNISELRQGRSEMSSEFIVLPFVEQRPLSIDGTWSASVRGYKGVLSGRVSVAVTEEAISVSSLLR